MQAGFDVAAPLGEGARVIGQRERRRGTERQRDPGIGSSTALFGESGG
uniref:Uncharacterized protein n=1 Tax=Achromobacter ruhlandii TaxID=72557 RepID=A0A482F3W8_9BURK|nr:hypothetical protein [Achromobacter ruhlandii]